MNYPQPGKYIQHAPEMNPYSGAPDFGLASPLSVHDLRGKLLAVYTGFGAARASPTLLPDRVDGVEKCSSLLFAVRLVTGQTKPLCGSGAEGIAVPPRGAERDGGRALL